MYILQSSGTALQEAIDNNHQEIVPLLMTAIKEAKEKVSLRHSDVWSM